MDKVKWGIISTANIGMEKVNPAMIAGKMCNVVAIASRSEEKARAAANQLGIEKSYGSYEAMLADPEIEAVYNPLPNHLHVPLSIQAADAGKHVLCEKPVAMNAEEARQLIAARDRNGVLIQEAFMTRSHPQWLKARELINDGIIGDLRSVTVVFSYFNVDPANVRNMADIGGGAIYDIGCYALTMPQFLFGERPQRIVSTVEFDPTFKSDRLASALVEYPSGHSQFMVSTQLVPYQKVQALGTKGRIEIEIPFNPPPDVPTRIFVDDGSGLDGPGAREIAFDVVDQYTIQGDLFSRAIRGEGEQVVPLETTILNMEMIDAVFQSAKERRWVSL